MPPLKTKKKFHSPNNLFRLDLKVLSKWIVDVYRKDHAQGIDTMVFEDITEHCHQSPGTLETEEAFEELINRMAADWRDMPWEMLNQVELTWGSMTCENGILTIDARDCSCVGFGPLPGGAKVPPEFCKHLYDFGQYTVRMAGDVDRKYPWDADTLKIGKETLTPGYAQFEGFEYDIDLLTHVLEIWAIIHCNIDPHRTSNMHWQFRGKDKELTKKRIAQYQEVHTENPVDEVMDIEITVNMPMKVKLTPGEHPLTREDRIVAEALEALGNLSPGEFADILRITYANND